MNDARGAVFQFIRASDKAPIAINPDGTYKGNVVADMQVMVAKAIMEGLIQDTPQLQTVVNSLDATIIDWASNSDVVYEPLYRCNGDSMHHVVKGMTVIRVEDAVGFQIEDNIIRGVMNLSPAPFDECYDYHKGANIENADDESALQQGMNIRGISVSAVTGYNDAFSSISRNVMNKFSSDYAKIVVGIDVQGKSNSISIQENTINMKEGTGEDPTDEYVALRLRKYSDVPENDIYVDANLFAQEIQTLTVAITEVSGCKRNNGNGNDWKVGDNPGGCPFGFKSKNKV